MILAEDEDYFEKLFFIDIHYFLMALERPFQHKEFLIYYFKKIFAFLA